MAIRIRLATPADGAACAAIYRPYVEQEVTSFELEAPDGDELARRIGRTLERTPWLVAEEGGEVLGYAYAGRWRDRSAYDWTAEVTVYLDRAHHGRGLGRALYSALLAVLDLQGFRTAVAGITSPNAASVGLHLAVGFERIGTFHAVGYKDGGWRDVEWFDRPIGERLADPAPIVPLPALLARPDGAPAVRAVLERAAARVGVR